MNVSALTDVQKAELSARLSGIDIVTWRWNLRGLLLHAFHGNFVKLRNREEWGVIAQTVRRQLQDVLPDVTVISRFGVMRVNYALLAQAARATLPYLDTLYQNQPTSEGGDAEPLDLQALLTRHHTADYQQNAVRSLALVHLYQEKLGAR